MATVADFKKAYTNTYWVTFADRKPGCIDCAPDDDPIAVASALGVIKTIDSLPYPADPVSPLVHLRIAYRCLVMAWAESEYFQPFVVAAAILAVMFAPIVYVVWSIW
jgi:hypothetical protein